MKKNLLLFSLFLFSALLLADNIITTGKRVKSKIDQLPKGKIADMSTIPQDPLYYSNQLEKVSYRTQLDWDKEYNIKYFKPWSLTTIDKTLEEMQWPFRSVTKKTIYNSNGSIIPPSTYNSWIDNANFGQLNNARAYGITVKHTDLKALPTRHAFYSDPSKTGEGFPFDYNQNSSYHMNTPLFISHYSLDNKWAFVRGSTTYGWVEVDNIAIVDKAFIDQFKNNNYSIVVQDNLKLITEQKEYSIIKLGTIFPTIIDKNKTKQYLFAKRGTDGKAVLQSAPTSKEGILAQKPIAMTPKNVAIIARQFYNEPYGWGGMLETRDCSSFTKDFFAPFGLFLRRNSSKQARDGAYCQIRGFGKEARKKSILTNAKPFQSMLYVPGHIVLYIGKYKGEPVIMHTYWGARLEDGSKKILARTVITTTEPGRELDEIKESSKLANTLRGIITLGE